MFKADMTKFKNPTVDTETFGEKPKEPYDAYLRHGKKKPDKLLEPMEFTMELESPMTKEDWEKITDVEMERTDKIVFTTPSLRKVTFVRANQTPCNMVTMTHERGGMIHFEFSDGLIKDVSIFKMPEKTMPTNGDVIQSMFPGGETYSWEELDQIIYAYNGAKMAFNYGWWNAPYKTESEE